MLALGLVLTAAIQAATPVRPASGAWDAWLDSPGGRLPFGLEIEQDASDVFAWLVNGDERIEVARVVREPRALTLHFEPYDSFIRAVVSENGDQLEGDWKKCAGPDRWTRLPFHARYPNRSPHDFGSNEFLADRWRVQFASTREPSVALLARTPSPGCIGWGLDVRATFLTTLGDYRFLSGPFRDGVDTRLELTCFDGAHAFLFKATLQADGSLKGDFWSGDSWHDTWTAVKDPNASLPDPFGLTECNAAVQLDALEFPDLEGKPKKLSDPAFAGRARILQVFGSWCPNCNDEAEFLRELDERYRERGLSIVGLAFELTGDTARDASQVKLYAARHRLAFPLLLAGTADKSEASKRLPLLDKVRAYPTTLFLHADGRVRAVHQGFCGPATGPEHLKLRDDFERLIDELLAEGEPKK